jgi:hypothetical protein
MAKNTYCSRSRSLLERNLRNSHINLDFPILTKLNSYYTLSAIYPAQYLRFIYRKCLSTFRVLSPKNYDILPEPIALLKAI